MPKPLEITREAIVHRLFNALMDIEGMPDKFQVGSIAEQLADSLQDLVGTVERTTKAVRESSAQIAKRHGHYVTAQNIRRGT